MPSACADLARPRSAPRAVPHQSEPSRGPQHTTRTSHCSIQRHPALAETAQVISADPPCPLPASPHPPPPTGPQPRRLALVTLATLSRRACQTSQPAHSTLTTTCRYHSSSLVPCSCRCRPTCSERTLLTRDRLTLLYSTPYPHLLPAPIDCPCDRPCCPESRGRRLGSLAALRFSSSYPSLRFLLRRPLHLPTAPAARS